MPASPIEQVHTATLRIGFEANFASARAASVAIRTFLAEQGVAQKELFPYELCIAEASNNAIQYSEGPSRYLKLIAEALITPAQVELRVTDHTAGFVLQERIPQPSPEAERGRGLFLIQSAMDEVRYLRGAKENTMVMRKKRRAASAPTASPWHDPSDVLTLEKSTRQLAESRSQMDRMAEELLLRSETLSSIFRCCAELGRIDTASEGFKGRLFSDLLRLTSADWYVLRLISPDGARLLVAATSESDLASKPIALPAAGATATSIEANVAASQKAARFDIRECSDRSEPLRSVGPDGAGLVCPLSFGGERVGTIAVGRRNGDFPLGRLQDDVIGTFAEFLAIQTLNLRRQKEEMRDRVIARELEIAQDIQQLLVPPTLPQLPGFGLAGGSQSAREVGGDFYDAIATGENSLLLVIADVMGKGVPAALFATEMRGLLRGLSARSADPAELLCNLNRLLYKDLSTVAMFITAQIVHVDLKGRLLTAASAGHCPILFVPPGDRSVSTLPIQGLPLGVRPNTVYPHHTARLGTPAALLLHTDGLTEARSPSGVAYGQRRLKAWLKAHAIAGRNATEMRDRLATEVTRFRGDTAMTDDQAFLLLIEEGADGAPPAPVAESRIRTRRTASPFFAKS
jgi:serine phosphatase RsbU (regulator of sigma subunit)/anti-sigma regulatory factor (Ser/Thr protein kinase)